MPESMSVERRRLLAAYGAEFELTPREQGMKGSIDKAHELVRTVPNAWMPMQFENNANVEIHRRKTAAEIAADFPEGIDYIVTGVGTGGHITGIALALKERFPNLKIFAVEPEMSPVLSGGSPGSHPIQGIGAGFIPPIMKPDLLDGIVAISGEEAFEFSRRAAREEGILVGISTGASLAAVSHKLEEANGSKRVLTFCYDTGERYLSIDGLF
jgi:cysteine synthase A